MCVCVCVYIYIYIYIFMCIYIYIYVCTLIIIRLQETLSKPKRCLQRSEEADPQTLGLEV